MGAWHIRCHVIDTAYAIECAEGAFAVRRDWAGKRACDRIASVIEADNRHACAHGAYGTSAIYAVSGYTGGEVIYPEPNTNMIYPRTVLPTLHARLEPGRTVLVCAVYSDPEDVLPGAESGDLSCRTVAQAEIEEVMNYARSL